MSHSNLYSLLGSQLTTITFPSEMTEFTGVNFHTNDMAAGHILYLPSSVRWSLSINLYQKWLSPETQQSLREIMAKAGTTDITEWLRTDFPTLYKSLNVASRVIAEDNNYLFLGYSNGDAVFVKNKKSIDWVNNYLEANDQAALLQIVITEGLSDPAFPEVWPTYPSFTKLRYTPWSIGPSVLGSPDNYLSTYKFPERKSAVV